MIFRFGFESKNQAIGKRQRINRLFGGKARKMRGRGKR
jgi:hypothetical protein